MHSVLFVAQIAKDRWSAFLDEAKVELMKSPDVSRLAENVWIVNLQKNPQPLGWLLSAAYVARVSYGILPFEHEPKWLPGDFDPKTIQGRNV